jgi:2-phosphosulfolactate phosphatase
MKITIGQLLEGATNARETAVVIDVFRAFSMACYMTQKGADAIYPVADIEVAYRLKQQNPTYILVGERNERRPEGFDFGNSPTQIASANLTGASIVHTTSSGTQGLLAAANGATTVLTGSFVNADAIVKYIQNNPTEHVSLCCMGYALKYPTEEDTLCAEYIKSRLEGREFDMDAARELIKKTSGRRFFEGHEHAPESDFHLCLELNKFDFVLKANKVEAGILKLEKKYL